MEEKQLTSSGWVASWSPKIPSLIGSTTLASALVAINQ